MYNIMPLIENVIADKADSIVFSVENGVGNILVKTNMNYWESNLASYIEDSMVFAMCFTKLFTQDFILKQQKHNKIFKINNTNYKIDYSLTVTDNNNFSIYLQIKDTNKILYNKKRVEKPALLLMEDLLKIANEKNASDIHICIRDIGYTSPVLIMFRIHGEVMHYNTDKMDLEQAYALCNTINNVLENKEIDNNETEEFMNILLKTIHYPVGEDLYKIGVGCMPCFPKGLDMIVRILPIDEVFKE